MFPPLLWGALGAVTIWIAGRTLVREWRRVNTTLEEMMNTMHETNSHNQEETTQLEFDPIEKVYKPKKKQS